MTPESMKVCAALLTCVLVVVSSRMAVVVSGCVASGVSFLSPLILALLFLMALEIFGLVVSILFVIQLH